MARMGAILSFFFCKVGALRQADAVAQRRHPSITVKNQTATLGANLIGAQGLNQNGNGALVVAQPVGYAGGTTNNAGTLALMGSLNTYESTPLSINNLVQSAATLNLDVNQNSDSASMNVIGGGTLTFIGTTNGDFSMTITGAEGSSFTIHGTTNLALTPLSSWPVAGSGIVGAGPTMFSDTNSTKYSNRYYIISTP